MGKAQRSHSQCPYPRDQFFAKSTVSFPGELLVYAWGAFSVMGALVRSDHLSKAPGIPSGLAAACPATALLHGALYHPEDTKRTACECVTL